jgi:hypothetical protein
MNTSRRRTPKPLVLGLSAACLAVVAIAATLAIRSGSAGGAQSAGPVPTLAPASKRVGFIGLPPEGATPSTPKSRELVISFMGSVPSKVSWADREWGVGRAWVYADGRLIWWREGDLPMGANHGSTGYLEQRLTPEGVELLRSEIMSTGVFGHAHPPLGSKGAGYAWVQVRDGDRFLSVDRASARDTRKLGALFGDPESWLPASAWDDREIRGYVPSSYAVCTGGPTQLVKPSRILTLLPESAQDVLRAGDKTRKEMLVSEPGEEGSPEVHVVYPDCYDVPTEKARALVEALDDAGLKRDGAYLLAYRLDASGPKRRHDVSFEPYLPHGESTCSPCG